MEELREKGLYGIFSVKTAHKGYPKKKLLETTLARGSADFMTTTVDLGYEGEGPELTILAGCHRDKKPMCVVATCGLLDEGPTRTRHRYKYQGG